MSLRTSRLVLDGGTSGNIIESDEFRVDAAGVVTCYELVQTGGGGGGGNVSSAQTRILCDTAVNDADATYPRSGYLVTRPFAAARYDVDARLRVTGTIDLDTVTLTTFLLTDTTSSVSEETDYYVGAYVVPPDGTLFAGGATYSLVTAYTFNEISGGTFTINPAFAAVPVEAITLSIASGRHVGFVFNAEERELSAAYVASASTTSPVPYTQSLCDVRANSILFSPSNRPVSSASINASQSMLLTHARTNAGTVTDSTLLFYVQLANESSCGFEFLLSGRAPDASVVFTTTIQGAALCELVDETPTATMQLSSPYGTTSVTPSTLVVTHSVTGVAAAAGASIPVTIQLPNDVSVPGAQTAVYLGITLGDGLAEGIVCDVQVVSRVQSWGIVRLVLPSPS